MVNAGDAFPAGEDYIVRRVKDLERKVDENASSIPRSFKTTVDSLTAAIETLTAQGITLNAQVAQIAAVVNAQVTGTVGRGYATGYTLTTTPKELARATITVPSGYTRALVLGITAMTIYNQNPSDPDFVRGYVDINGNNGPTSGSLYAPMNFPVSMMVSYSYLLTGLTGGSTFYIRSVFFNEYGNTAGPSASNICNLDAMVTFLR